MTIIDKLLNCERGSAAVEAVFVFMFFSGLFIYTFQQACVMVLSYSVEKASSQAVSLIAQRSTLFGDKNLQVNDVDLIRNHIPMLSKQAQNFFDVYIEEIAYQTGKYLVVYSPSNDGSQCTLKAKLSDYNFNVQTSFSKKNSMYRVTVCRKISNVFFADEGLIIGSSSVMPGHHH